METRLFAWDADRSSRFARFDDAPFDDEGNALSLYDPDVTIDGSINLLRPRHGELGDFLYSPLLLLFVSRRVIETLADCEASALRARNLVIRDAAGHVVDDTYVWLELTRPRDILDLQRSEYEPRPLGGIKRLTKAVVDDAKVPADDLFLCAELNLPIFRGHAVDRIRSRGLTGAEFTALDDLTWPL